jgi:hypothetical protein
LIEFENFDIFEKWTPREHSIYSTGGQIGNDNFYLFSGLIRPLPPENIRIKQEWFLKVVQEVWTLGYHFRKFMTLQKSGHHGNTLPYMVKNEVSTSNTFFWWVSFLKENQKKVSFKTPGSGALVRMW